MADVKEVFISFRFGEAHKEALALKAALEQRDVTVFLSDAYPGQNLQEMISIVPCLPKRATAKILMSAIGMEKMIIVTATSNQKPRRLQQKTMQVAQRRQSLIASRTIHVIGMEKTITVIPTSNQKQKRRQEMAEAAQRRRSLIASQKTHANGMGKTIIVIRWPLRALLPHQRDVLPTPSEALAFPSRVADGKAPVIIVTKTKSRSNEATSDRPALVFTFPYPFPFRSFAPSSYAVQTGAIFTNTRDV